MFPSADVMDPPGDIKYIHDVPQSELRETEGKCVLIDPGRRDLLFCMHESSTTESWQQYLYTRCQRAEETWMLHFHKLCEKAKDSFMGGAVRLAEARLGQECCHTLDPAVYSNYVKVYAEVWPILKTRWLKGRYTTRDYRGHKDVVLAVRLDPVRRLMFSGSRDGTIKVWNLDNHRCVKTLKGHTAAVACLDYDSRTRVLVTGSWDGTVQIWRMSETMAHIVGESDHMGEELGECPGSRSSYGRHLRSRRATKYGGAGDGSLPRDVRAHFTGQTTFELHTSPSASSSTASNTASTAAAYLPSALGSGSTPFPANDRSRPQFTCTHILDHGEEVICLRYKGNEIAVGTGSGLVQLWDATTGNCLSIYNFYTNDVMTPQVAHDASVIGCVDLDSRYIYAGVGDSIAVFDRVQKSILSYVHIHSSSVTALKLDASFLVSGAEDSSVLIWHRDQMVQRSSTLPVQRVTHNCLDEESRGSVGSTTTSLTANVGQQVTTPETAPLLLEHDARTAQFEQIEPHMLHGHLSGVRCLQTHGNILCTGSYDTTIRVWSIKKDREECILKLKGHIGDVNTIDMTEDLIVSGSDEGVIKVWDFRSKANLPQPLLVDDQGTPIPIRGKL
ncbi:hypothetical protein IWQ61_004964 [Dispira simplex]|nr:hypothetical protein IWQ61_004964 [Dispira simplex]